MALHLPDFVRVTIDGTDRTAYVISYSRHSTLCSFSDVFTLEVSFEIPQLPDPYDEITIRELYGGENEKVLGGYIIDVIQDFDRGTYVINGQDKTLLLDDYFIHTQHFANNESVGYWMNWYANLVGLTVQYDSSVSQFTVEEGTPMGMITASEGIALLERLAAVYIKYDAEIDKLRVFRINTSEPVINITNDSTTSFKRETGTEKTRNVVKVHGGYRFNIFDGTSTQAFATARTDIPELIVNKTAVVVNPLIRRTTIAQIVASRILGLVDELDDIVIIDTAGFYPFVDVGEHGSINVGRGDFTYNADRQITSIQTAVDTGGAITIFTVGEKCPRISIMPPLSIVYATALHGGILVSYDGGNSFDPFNRGIISGISEVASGVNGLSVAANKHGQLMSIADNTLYRRTGKYGSWYDITSFLPTPSNDEGMDIPTSITNLTLNKVEKEASAYGRFHVLAGAVGSGIGGGGIPIGQERWWTYWTSDFGATWGSMQLYLPGSGIPVGAPSGLPRGLINGEGITQAELQTAATTSGSIVWDVAALDIEGGYGGDVTVLVGKPPVIFEEQFPLEIYIAQDYTASVIRCCVYDGTTLDIQQAVTMSGFSITARMWSCPSNRDIAYMAAISNDGPTSTYTGAQTYVWKTTDAGDNWYEVHNELLQASSPESMISSYSINFDPLSNSNEVRVGFVGFEYISDSYYRANARFINSDPFGSATRTDDTENITLTPPSLTGGESFGGFGHGNGTTAVYHNLADKSCRVDGYMWGTMGTYGGIYDGGRTDTAKNALIVRLNFSTKTVQEFSQLTWRAGNTNNVPAQCKAYSAENLSTIYACVNSLPSLYKVVNTSWSSKGAAGRLGNGGFPRYGAASQPVFWWLGGFPGYDYSIRSTTGNDTVIDFYPDGVGNLNRQHVTVAKQFQSAINYWCFSDSVVLGEPDGFCYSSDSAVTWIQHWAYQVLSVYDFDWKTWEE